MLSSSNIETLIAVKRREIEKEKTVLGLSTRNVYAKPENDKQNAPSSARIKKRVNIKEKAVLSEHNDATEDKKENKPEETDRKFEEIPPDLERYIRKYLGLPVMLKAGEYSPNNPLVRGERAPGDALLGLGEYERRRNTLRKIRQQQYREYLDQQAKKKQEEKEQAEKKRRDREQREKEREERDREIQLERDRYSPERRRSMPVQNVQLPTPGGTISKVDTGVQVDGFSQPLSVAVQTDDTELFRLCVSPLRVLTRAERELSPRCARADAPPAPPAAPAAPPRRSSHGDCHERPFVKRSNRDKLTADLRHSYMPSIFDAETIRLRNVQAEKEAAERRQYYQQELKNQIQEQQRIKEERKSREKMLEQAEMRRLEEQLRMLRMAQEKEKGVHHDINAAMQQNTSEYNMKRIELQREIDTEKHTFLRASSHPIKTMTKRTTTTSKSDTNPSKLPFFYPRVLEKSNEITEKKAFSMNIPDNSIFSSNYDVESYLRRNLNFNKEKNIDYRYNDENVSKYDDEIENNHRFDDHRLPKLDKEEKVPKYDDKPRYELHNYKNKEQHDSEGIETTHHYERDKMHKFNRDNGDESKILTINKSQKLQTLQRDDTHSFVQDIRPRYAQENEIHRFKQGNESQRFAHENELHNLGDDQSVVEGDSNRKIIVEKALIHRPEDRPIERKPSVNVNNFDTLPIPVLRHSPKLPENLDDRSNMSEAMKKVDDKWKVPAVQKNILKALPNEEGKNISILTQLGSIRRQLQLEQLKLDRMISKDDV